MLTQAMSGTTPTSAPSTSSGSRNCFFSGEAPPVAGSSSTRRFRIASIRCSASGGTCRSASSCSRSWSACRIWPTVPIGDPVARPHPELEPAPARLVERLDVHHRRHEQVRRAARLRAREAVRPDADHFVHLPADPDGRAGHAGVAAEAALPVVVRDAPRPDRRPACDRRAGPSRRPRAGRSPNTPKTLPE